MRLLDKYSIATNYGPDFFKFERFGPNTAWGHIYKWILKAGPVEIRKRVVWRKQ